MVPLGSSRGESPGRDMQVLEADPYCPDCSKRLVDVVDEFVCPSCGRTLEKEAADPRPQRVRSAVPSAKEPLGSYMGSKGITAEERRSKGVGGNGSTYEYLKVVSDFAGRSEGAPAVCAKMIERIGEKLLLPKFVRLEAQSIAKRVLELPHPRRRVAIAPVSAYALISACKLERVTSVSVREIVEAHAALGRQVTSSSIIKLTLESPIKTYARSAEEYLTRVVARLTMNRKLQEQLATDGVRQTEYANSLRDTASELLRSVSQESRAGRRPCALAGSAVYSAEAVMSRVESRKRRLTQRELAECCDTAEYTVREQCASIFALAAEELVRRRMRPQILREAR